MVDFIEFVCLDNIQLNEWIECFGVGLDWLGKSTSYYLFLQKISICTQIFGSALLYLVNAFVYMLLLLLLRLF